MKKIILSDNKQNHLVDEITAALVQRHEFQDGVINGKEIATFCPHQQVGNFILFRIYQDWNAHMQHFVHPYFDFGHPEVREGLRRFQNTVSQHIRINEDDFKKLVRSAVYNNLKLILNPEETIVNFFFSNAQAISAEIYARHAPYFSDFDFAIKSILRYLQKNEIERVERSLFLEKFAKVIDLFEKKEGKTIGQYQRFLFRRLTGKEMDEVVGSAAPPADKKDDTQDAEEKEKNEQKQKEEEARRIAEAEKREEQRMAAEIRREEEVRIAAEEARRKVEAQKEKESLDAEKARKEAEETQRKEEEEKARLRIKVTPKPRTEPENNPAPEKKEPSLPPWVDPPKEEVKKEETPPKQELPTEPPATLPPWVERNQRKESAPNPEIKIVSSTPDEGKKEEKTEKPAEKEAPKTVSEVLRDKQKEDTPRSLNEMFSNREKPTTLLDRSREEQESHQEKRVGDLAGPKTPVVNQPPVDPPKEKEEEKAPIVAETTSPPQMDIPKTEEKEATSGPPEVSLFIHREEEEKEETPSDANPPRTLADSFKDKQDGQGSINEQHSSKSIKTEQIPVHKQFQFVQRVFGGSSVKFKVVLDKINKTETVEEALQVLDKYVYNDPSVNRTDKVAKEFEQLVKAKFE